MKLKNQLYKILVIPVAALLMGGCKNRKQYTPRPQIDLPSTLDSTSVDTMYLLVTIPNSFIRTHIPSATHQNLGQQQGHADCSSKVKELAAMKRIDYANLFPQVGLKFYAEQEGEDHGGGHYKSDDQYDI